MALILGFRISRERLSNLAGRPAAAAALDGTFWKTREGAGTKGYLWVCMRNDANAYEWVQVGITT